MGIWFALVVATFVSEDLTCIAAGLLIQRGEVAIIPAIVACVVGIFAGDMALWALGRGLGRAVFGRPWMARRLRGRTWTEISNWLDRHAAGAIVASRFTPGTRLPLYVVAGVVGTPAAAFALWSLTAVLLWTPTIVLMTAAFGETFAAPIARLLGPGITARVVAAAALILLVRALGRSAEASRYIRCVARAFRRARVRVSARLARWSRWEFWPSWIFYSPVAVWTGMLALRYRGFSTITAANPGMADGGTVGESKYDILAQLPRDCTIPAAVIPSGALADRIGLARERIEQNGWQYPLIVKPDVGQRGVGVKLARTFSDIERYLRRESGKVIVQPYHPGPFEAGVFYYRFPGEPRGRILSITDKHFPVVVGDGRSTLEELIWSHPRYRMQAATFITRHRDKLAHVLLEGEHFQLTVAGNHAQGTLFRDGSHLITPALTRRIDEIAGAYPGFFIGRFDIRYREVEAFRMGRDLAIVELNGATAESTNIYDPDGSLIDAYKLLFRQWSIVFAIGAANRAAGAPVTTTLRLVELLRAHLSAAAPFPISD
jgi:membrane protein DedA with SNARE-associated domain